MPVPSNDTVLKMNTEIDNAKYSIIYAYKIRLCETEYRILWSEGFLPPSKGL